MAKTTTTSPPAADAPMNPKAAKRRYRLTHHSCKPGYEGEAGMIIEVDDAGAKWLDDVGGGYEVDADGKYIPKVEE